MIRVVYVAGPYRNPDGAIKRQNIQNAREAGEKIWEAGIAAIIPHTNTALFDETCQAPDDVYLEGYIEILTRCDALLVLPGAQGSAGSQAEIREALLLGIPVFTSLQDLIDAHAAEQKPPLLDSIPPYPNRGGWKIYPVAIMQRFFARAVDLVMDAPVGVVTDGDRVNGWLNRRSRMKEELQEQ